MMLETGALLYNASAFYLKLVSILLLVLNRETLNQQVIGQDVEF